MSVGSVLSVGLTLAVVLGLMGVALKILRKYAIGSASQPGTVGMEVIQRLTLGQRQGLAVVRVGERMLVISMGDGGVHPIAELDAVPQTTDDASAGVTMSRMVPAGAQAKVTEIVAGMITAARASLRKEPLADVQPSSRVPYVAPLEDFQTVLNMSLHQVSR